MNVRTPDLCHFTSADYELFYEPAEDTFLLLDALESDFDEIQRIRPLICLEVGCGSGCVITFLGKLLGPHLFYLCTDINQEAAAATLKTGNQNGIPLNPLITDLAFGLLPRLRRSIDVIVFNPPYVVTSPDEMKSQRIEAAWAGGIDGRQVMDRFFPLVAELLSENGLFYMVAVKENKADEIEVIMSNLGFNMSIVLSRRAGPERLTILKFARKTDRVS